MWEARHADEDGRKPSWIHTSRPGLTFNNSGPLCSQLTEERDRIWLESMKLGSGARQTVIARQQTPIDRTLPPSQLDWDPAPVKVRGLGHFTRCCPGN